MRAEEESSFHFNFQDLTWWSERFRCHYWLLVSSSTLFFSEKWNKSIQEKRSLYWLAMYIHFCTTYGICSLASFLPACWHDGIKRYGHVAVVRPGKSIRRKEEANSEFWFRVDMLREEEGGGETSALCGSPKLCTWIGDADPWKNGNW